MGIQRGVERRTIHKVREAVRTGKIPTEFRATQVNDALGITWAGNFLAKHCVGKQTGDTKLFIRVSRGLYRLNAVSGG